MRRTFAVLGTIAALSLGAAPEASAGAQHLPKTKIERSRGKFIPLPKQIPGERDTWIDSRISGDLIWAKLAEPKQGHTSAPFDWVGYDGDLNHGCGNHLHLSWNHTSKWVQIFSLRDWLGTRP